MKVFQNIVLTVCMTFFTIFAVWFITRMQTFLTGLIGTALMIAGCRGVYLAAPVIAVALVWVVRFAVVFAVYGFILGFYPYAYSTDINTKEGE